MANTDPSKPEKSIEQLSYELEREVRFAVWWARFVSFWLVVLTVGVVVAILRTV